MDGQKSWKGAKLHNEANVEVHMPSPSQHAPVHCAVIVVVVVVVDVVEISSGMQYGTTSMNGKAETE